MKRRKHTTTPVRPVEPKVIAVADDGAKRIDYDGQIVIAYDDCRTCFGSGRRSHSWAGMYQSKRQCEDCEGRYNHDRETLLKRGKELSEQAERLYRQDKKQNGTDKASFAEALQFEALAREYRQIVKWVWNGAPEPAPFKEMTA